MKRVQFICICALLISVVAMIAKAGDTNFIPGSTPTVVISTANEENVEITFGESVEGEPVEVSQGDNIYLVNWESDGVTFDAYPFMNPLLPTLNGTLSSLPNGNIKFSYAFTFFEGGGKAGSVIFNNSQVISMTLCECSYQTDITTYSGSSKNCEKHVKCPLNIQGAQCWDSGIKIESPPPPLNPNDGIWARFCKWCRSWF